MSTEHSFQQTAKARLEKKRAIYKLDSNSSSEQTEQTEQSEYEECLSCQ